MYLFFHTGTVVPENLNQNVDNSTFGPSMKLQTDYLLQKNSHLDKKNHKKKGKIRFKCLHCDYLTLKKQNLVKHLRQKHQVCNLNFTKDFFVSSTLRGTLYILLSKFIFFRLRNNLMTKLITVHQILQEPLSYLSVQYVKWLSVH